MTGMSHWLAYHQPDPAARGRSLRLFCFPYAGGSALLYRNWQLALPAEIEVCPVQLPGRGLRLNEPAMTSIYEMSAAALSGLLPLFQEPFALFGHSMGALIAFELCRLLERERQIVPAMLLVAGARAPHLREEEAPTWNLPNAEFIEKLRDMNGTPEEALADPELMEFLSPVIRADFRAVQSYKYKESGPLSSPIAAFGGLKDEDVTIERLKGWRSQTLNSFSYSLFSGDHFFINSCRRELLNRVALKLAPILDARGRRPFTTPAC
jgi:medium-chain acyl-[acyl-carrier-protein] hydrolase